MDLASVALALVTVWLVGHAIRFARFYYCLWLVPGSDYLEFDWTSGHLNAVLDRVELFHELTPKINEVQHRIRRFMVGPLPTIVVSHPETVAIVLKQSSPKLMLFYGLLLPFIGDGLLVSSGKKWARDRRLLTNAFHFNILQEYTPVLQDACQVFLDRLQQHTQNAETQSLTFDFSKACCLLTLDVMLRCTMGVDSNCQLEESEYTKGVREVTEAIFQRSHIVHELMMPDWMYFMTQNGRHFKKLCDMCHEFSGRIIKERQQKLEEEGRLLSARGEDGETALNQVKIAKGHVDFLEILLTVRDEDGSGLSDAEIRDQVDTFLFAGHDTTASGMQWMFYFMAKHPEAQQKCRQEAQKLMGSDGLIPHGDLAKLTYINQCIKESLRMCTPVPEVNRTLSEDTVVDGYLLPKGTGVSVDFFSLHHGDYLYPDPYTFDPSRFSEENSRERHPHAFVPFSAGPRNCIGQVLAMNELKSVLANVLTRFQLSVDDSLPEPKYTDTMIMHAKNGIQLLVKSWGD